MDDKAKWAESEKIAFNYLSSEFKDRAEFKICGGSDSTVSDILVIPETAEEFYVEVKKLPAQCGRFVAFPVESERRFVYSKRNSPQEPDDAALKIISYMNENFENFKNPRTRGVSLDAMPDGESVFSEWIKKHLEDKKAKFIIALASSGNPVMFPVEEISDYFSITATYRVKKSGSSSASQADCERVCLHLKEAGIDVPLVRRTQDGKVKHIVRSERDLSVSEPIELSGEKYIFSHTAVCKDGEFEIRRLGKTLNANVIFSVKLKQTHPEPALEKFSQALKGSS